MKTQLWVSLVLVHAGKEHRVLLADDNTLIRRNIDGKKITESAKELLFETTNIIGRTHISEEGWVDIIFSHYGERYDTLMVGSPGEEAFEEEVCHITFYFVVALPEEVPITEGKWMSLTDAIKSCSSDVVSHLITAIRSI